jgi:hypothetical protein
MSIINFISQAHKLNELAHNRAKNWHDDHSWAIGARDVLQEILGNCSFDPIELLEHCMYRCGPVPTFNGLGFSDHPLTLWSTDIMSLDVYYWYPGETAPHDHGFHGAFMPVIGEYAETIYNFFLEVDLGEGMELGKLTANEKVILKNGVAQAINHAPSFIHQVNHESFCVTLCLRSRFSGTPMSDYFSPGVKLSTRKDLVNGAHEDWQRFMLLLDHKPQSISEVLKRASVPVLARWWFKEMYPSHRHDIKKILRDEILRRNYGDFIMGERHCLAIAK